MSDWTDDASAQEELHLQVALQRQLAQSKKHEAALEAASGHCLNCDEPLEEGRFCDADCREDFQRRIRVNRR